MADRQIFYKYAGGPVFGEFVSVSRFVVTEGEKRRLLLRCFNRGDRVVTGLRIAVHFLNDDGTERDRREFTVSGLFGEPDTEFAVPDIPLPPFRHNVRAEIVAVRSYDREYDFRDGSVSYVGPPKRKTVQKRDKTSSPLAKYAVMISVLMLLLASVSVLVCLLKTERKEETAQTVSAERAVADEEIC